MTRRTSEPRYVVCVSNRRYRASLVVRRIYRSFPDEKAARRGLIRIVDETDEDYLYPRKLFMPIELTEDIGRALAVASSR